MRWDIIKSDWPNWAKRIKKQYSEFTDSELAQVGGDRNKLARLFQQKFGWTDIRTDRVMGSIFGY